MTNAAMECSGALLGWCWKETESTGQATNTEFDEVISERGAASASVNRVDTLRTSRTPRASQVRVAKRPFEVENHDLTIGDNLEAAS